MIHRRLCAILFACVLMLHAQTTLRQAGAQRALLIGAAANADETAALISSCNPIMSCCAPARSSAC